MNAVPQTITQSAKLTPAFAAPMLTYQWRDTHGLNAEIKRLAFELMRGERGPEISNKGGWNSKRDILDLNHPSLKTLEQMLHALLYEMLGRVLENPRPELLNGWQLEAWMNVNYPNGFNELHNHGRPPSVWSAIYYVDLGTDDALLSGQTVFENCHMLPRAKGAELSYAHPETISPNPGLMALFPSSFFHSVQSHQGNRPRITIAFNLSHPLWQLSTGPLDEFLSKRQNASQQASWRKWMWQNFRGLMRLRRWVYQALSS